MTMKTINQIRVELAMTQRELGQLLDKAQSTIGRWETDEVKLDLEAVRQEAIEQGCPLPGEEGFKFRKIASK